MKRTTTTWTISHLRTRFFSIDFPEFQREPNIWSLDAKRRLIDSLLRRFDIAPLYFFEDSDNSVHCIDGRQRINAIMAFLGANESDDDNRFTVRILNEIYTDDSPFASLSGQSFDDLSISQSADETAREAVTRILDYELTIIMLSQARRAEEFNLQFTRLNLGTVINAGEKLHAMVGTMRDICFDDARVGQHPFLNLLNIPLRRFAREQVAAQIMMQVFSFAETGTYGRARHFDLQRFLKVYSEVDPRHRLIQEVSDTFGALHQALGARGALLKNRAIAVSVVLFVWERRFFDDSSQLENFVDFIDEFLCRLRWQIGKGLDIDQEYRHLTDFQRDITQAAVEKPAIERRANVLQEQFEVWVNTGGIKGDEAYEARTAKQPSSECRT